MTALFGKNLLVRLQEPIPTKCKFQVPFPKASSNQFPRFQVPAPFAVGDPVGEKNAAFSFW